MGVKYHGVEEEKSNADKTLYTLYNHAIWIDRLFVQIFLCLAWDLCTFPT